MALRRIATVGVGALLFGLVAGCATTTTPRELLQAQQVYQRAAASPAHERVVAELREARIAIDRATEMYNSSPSAAETRDFSYIALRKSELALAEANALLAQDMRTQAMQQAQVLRERSQRMSREELIRMREQIAAQTRELQQRADELQERRSESAQTQEQLRMREQELSQAREQMAGSKAEMAMREQQLSQRQRELEQERAAREAAERRAQQAMNDLRALGNVKQEERGLVLTLSGAVLFASGKSQLLPIAQDRLSQVAEVLRQNPNQKIVVEGYTDSVGSDQSNMVLSQQRADAVRSFLVSRGVPAEMISAVGQGETRPIADNGSPEGRANNRRVEIVMQPMQRGRNAPGYGSGMQDQGTQGSQGGSMQGGSMQGGSQSGQQGGSMQGGSQGGSQSGQQGQPGTDQGRPVQGSDLQQPATPPAQQSPSGSDQSQQAPSPTTPPEKVQQPGQK